MSTPKPSTLLVQFSIVPMRNEARSRLEGREVLEDAEMVTIRIPGSPDFTRNPVTDEHRRIYEAEYSAWRRGARMPGTDLALWGRLNQEQIAELHHFGVYTVEMLANVSDALATFSQPKTLRREAAEWLTTKAAEAETVERVRRDTEADALKTKVAELETRLARFLVITEGANADRKGSNDGHAA